MTPIPVYAWIKALHVASVIAFVAGAFAQSLFIATARSDASAELAQRFRRAERAITAPAAIVAVASGLFLAMLGRWFPAPWILIKLVLVVALFSLHGYQSGRLRRLATLGQNAAPWPLHSAVIALAAIIATLAVLKPTPF